MSAKRKRTAWEMDPWNAEHPAHDWFMAARALAGQLVIASEDRGAYVAAMFAVDAEKVAARAADALALEVLLDCGAPRPTEAMIQRVRDADARLAAEAQKRRQESEGK